MTDCDLGDIILISFGCAFPKICLFLSSVSSIPTRTDTAWTSALSIILLCAVISFCMKSARVSPNISVIGVSLHSLLYTRQAQIVYLALACLVSALAGVAQVANCAVHGYNTEYPENVVGTILTILATLILLFAAASHPILIQSAMHLEKEPGERK